MATEEKLDFDAVLNTLSEQSSRAQNTFVYRLVQVLGPGVLRSMTRYAFLKLDEINSSLPDGNIHKENYKRREHERKNLSHNKPQKQYS